MTQQQNDSGGLGAFAGLVLLIVILAIIFIVTTPGLTSEIPEDERVVVAPTDVPTDVPTEAPTDVPEPTAEPEQSSDDSGADLDPEMVAQGEQLYVGTCSACHGPDATGIQGLGKDLVNGEFSLTTNDEDLVSFIITGRPSFDPANTTYVDMPPRGGNPALTDDEIASIVTYIRSLQGGSGDVHGDAQTDMGASDDTGDSGADLDPEMVALGEQLFVGTCSACHGPDATGIQGLGKDLVNGEFSLTTNDEDLASFIITGRPSFDPANTTYVDMPPRGGNPALTDDEIDAIVAYIRSLQQ